MLEGKMYLNRPRSVRLSKECNSTAEELMNDYPKDYENLSQVIRAAIFALKRWKDTPPPEK